MIKPTDETLMAYADGLLDPSQRAEIESLCAEDAKLRARLGIFRATGRNLGHLFQHHIDAPVPERLLDFIQAQELKLARGKTRRRSWFRSRRDEHADLWRFLDAAVIRTAAFASVSMVVGVGFGWLLHGTTSDQTMALTGLVQVEKNRLIAGAPLQRSLDNLYSSTKAKLALAGSRDAELKIKMTFRNEARDYCRLYEITTSSPERYAGVACRTGDQWSIHIQAMVPPSDVSPGQFVPAGVNDTAMDAVVRSLIDEGPLSPTDEAAIIEGWKK
jgi:hypothetical protein